MFRTIATLAVIAAANLLVHAESTAQRPNVLLICIDDLRPELGCYGVDYIQSPNIDRLASQSRLFRHHYVQAPTCGASRNALLTGVYGGRSNNALFQRAEQMEQDKPVPVSMPGWFRQNGYATVSVGKVSHHPGGRGGPNWDDPAIPEMPGAWDRHLLPAGPWQHPRGAMHGLANGEIRVDRSKMDVFQSTTGADEIYPDGLITNEAISQLDALANDGDQPFFLAVGIIRPHLPFGAPAKYMQPYRDAKLPAIPHPTKPAGKTTWHGSGEFMTYNRWDRNPNQDAEFALEVRRHYAACVSYADAMVGRILDQLSASPAADNTVVVLWGDHGWHLGEHAIWGKHALFEESLRSPLIIRAVGTASDGVPNDAVVETVDLFPTLCELTNLNAPDGLVGQSLVPAIKNNANHDGTAIAYNSKAETIRSPSHRLTVHRDGSLELYDHRTPEGETRNLAKEEPEVVAQLKQQLTDRLNQAATKSAKSK
ncbi:Arylsulfatase [Rubripirellula lacrimiformis]|uniref:Arylsulfatase n=1 Tax=Rubripirellula lacrimiformis TaxID=1930273 RepID=A0A517NAG1_9BACT|nr:sulfatase [Rubripirellula lacrimiformis]QDT04126.1 Arylsulfatase [Rubripirellula lacrimiformis]